MALTIIHGIQQNILQMVSFDKIVPLLLHVLQVSPLLVAAFTSKIIAPPLDPF